MLSTFRSLRELREMSNWLLIFVEVAANMAISAPNDDNNSHLSVLLQRKEAKAQRRTPRHKEKKIIDSCHIAATVAK